MIRIAIFSASGSDAASAATEAAARFNRAIAQSVQGKPIEVLSVAQQTDHKTDGTAWSVITLVYRGLVAL